MRFKFQPAIALLLRRRKTTSSPARAALPRPKDTLRRLKEQGVLARALQAHLNRYFSCLDLFYRLAFLAVGYRGKFHDLSVGGWPVSHFLGIQLEAAEKPKGHSDRWSQVEG